MKLAVLAEEFGEVAREVFEMHDRGDFTPARRAALRKELEGLGVFDGSEPAGW